MALYFSGYASLQFQLRHFFHLEFLWWFPYFLVLGFFSSAHFRTTVRQWYHLPDLRQRCITLWPRLVTRCAGIAVAIVSLTMVPYAIAYSIQSPKVEQMYRAYGNLQLRPVSWELIEQGLVARIGVPGLKESNPDDSIESDGFKAEYLVLEFIALEPITFWTQYDPLLNNYSTRIDIDAATGPDKTVRYFLPVYQASPAVWYCASLQEILLPSRYMPLLRSIETVSDLDNLDVLVPLTLYADSSNMPLSFGFQRYEKPFLTRALLAQRTNLISNGDLEIWPAGEAPLNFALPGGNAFLERSETVKSTGAYSVKLTWTSDCSASAISQRFRTAPLSLEPRTTYELFVDGYNCSEHNVMIGVWELSENDAGETQTFRLSPAVVEFRSGKKFGTSAGRFTTTSNESATVVLAVTHLGDSYPATVYLDNFRLARVR
jgi:hypothetical protein